MRRVLTAAIAGFWILGAAAPAAGTAPESPYFDFVLDEGIFALYAAMNLGGYNQVTNFLGMYPLRADIRQTLAAKEGLEETTHNIAHAAHELGHHGGAFALSRYILAGEGPPLFNVADTGSYSVETRRLVEEGREVGLSSSLSVFYREVEIGAIWESARPEYEHVAQELARVADRKARTAFASIGIEGKENLPSRVRVIINLLAPYWSNSRFSYEGKPHVVIGPGVEPDPSLLIRALLEAVFAEAVEEHLLAIRARRDLFDLVRDQERIESCCDAFNDLVTECLVWAAWLQVCGEEEQWVRGELDRLYARGYILVGVFYHEMALGSARSPSELVGRVLGAVHVKQETERWRGSETERQRWLTIFQADLDRRQGRLTDALIRYREILEADPDNPRANYGYGSLLYTQERYDDALEVLNRAIAVNPDEEWVVAWSWIRIGWIEDLAGNRQSALRAYRSAVETGSTYMNAREIAGVGLEKPFESR
ncbi:MAG: tetratricopeptide repeat protein [Candidatus Eisenbacteria sp.]|nr:tetratricopeptide repeat protein [Candidatus Eisenbacteria bacterium]